MHLLQGFYEEVASPLLREVDISYPDNTVEFLTTNHFSQLFNGSEIVVAGRLTDNSLDNFLVEVFGQGVRRRKYKDTNNAEAERMPETSFLCLCSLKTTSVRGARPALRTGA